MPKWVHDLIDSLKPAADLRRDLEKLKWEVRTLSLSVETLAAAVVQTNANVAVVNEAGAMLAVRVTQLEQQEVPDYVLDRLAEIRARVARMVPQGMLPASPSTSGGVVVHRPHPFVGTIFEVPPAPAPAPDESTGWKEGQPPI